MNNNVKFEEQEIDLLDFVINMLEQWKGWLLAGLIFMLLLPCVKYAIDLRNYDSTPVIQDVTSATVESSSSAEKIILSSNRDIALNFYVALLQLKESYDKSLVMDLDATHVRRLNLEYYINCPDSERASLTSLYSNLSFDEGFVVKVAEAMDIEQENFGAVAELIDVSSGLEANHNENNSGIVLFSIILPNDIDEETVEKAVSSYMSNLSNNVSAQMGEHDVILVSSGVITLYDWTVVDIQSSTVSDIYNCEKDFLDIYKSLTSAEKSEVDDVITKLDSGELGYQDIRTMYSVLSVSDIVLDETVADNAVAPVEELVVPARVTFSKMYAILGFAVGILLYVGCAFAEYIMVKRFKNGEEAANILSLRSYGDIFEYPYHGIRAFLHDKRIYAWRHKNSSNVDNVSQAISAKAKFNSNNKLTCIVLGDAGKKGMTTLEDIVKKVSESGIEIELKKAPEGLYSISEEEICKFSPVLITVVSDKTRPIKAFELLTRLKEYNIPVFGLNFIET